MNSQRGYYSLIQFCPDVSRLESVNVGVILFCPAAGYLDARTSSDNRRAEKLVGRGNLERFALNAAKRAIEHRLQVDRDSFNNIEDLQNYINTRGNLLKLTSPRPVKVFDPPNDLKKLYAELVGGRSTRQRMAEERKLFPRLDKTFRELQSEGRAELDKRVTIPILEKSLDVPYTYSNGALNLIKPLKISRADGTSMNTAIRLALEGDLINRHGTVQSAKTRLIVVTAFEKLNDASFIKRVNDLFGEYDVENVNKQRLRDFIEKVKREAH